MRTLRALVCAAAVLSPVVSFGQATRASSTVEPSKMDFYVGYGYWNPMTSSINGFRYDTLSDMNAAGNFSYFFTKNLGVTVDGNYFNDNRTHVPLVSGICGPDATGKLRCYKDQAVTTLSAGPVYRRQYGRFVPFAHVLGGAEQINGPVSNPLKWGWMAQGGVGVDYVLPFLHDHVAVRPIQADYQFGHINYGALVLPAGIVGGSVDMKAIHLSAGVVVRLGTLDKTPVDLACPAEPSLVYPNETVTASAMARGFGKNPHLDYTWTVPGGKPVHDSAALISTANLAPGDYKVTVAVGQHGRKPRATCNTGFTVHAYEPPTLSCSASPATVAAGEVVAITATGRSPQNRSLTYNYSASTGTFAGTGPSTQLTTAGAVPGAVVSVNCEVTDDLGQKATASTTVSISAPPPPPVVVSPVMAAPVAPTSVPEVAHQESLCTILFERDRKRPTRVDNEAKACLDSVALSKNRETLSKLVLVGTYTSRESANAAAERALHAKQYLVDEKGIDPSSIQTMVKASTQKSVVSTLLPGDAVFEDEGAMDFDPATVRLHGEAYGVKHLKH